MSAADADRLALGAAAVLRPSRAAELLPWDSAEALRWLRTLGLVRRVVVPGESDAEGRTLEVVVWGDVLAALRGERQPTAPATAGRRSRGSVPYADPDR
ncbi:MAG TPA: hypothetical protein VEB22_15335 [Phycisphaerales bacterium]|nr:hypothetical protein [Phycisphaerales bacterium]